MDVQKAIAAILALRHRAEILAESAELKDESHLTSRESLSPSRLLSMIETAKDARKLYQRALREAHFLEMKIDNPHLSHLISSMEKSLFSLHGNLAALERRSGKWGIPSERETLRSFEPETKPRRHNIFDEPRDTERDPGHDLSEAYDIDHIAYFDQDHLREECFKAMKTLAGMINYLDPDTLVRLKKGLQTLTRLRLRVV